MNSNADSSGSLKQAEISLASGGRVHPDFLSHARKSYLTEVQQEAFLQACGRPLRPAVRVNRLKISLSAFKQIASRYDWQLTEIPWCDCGFWVDESRSQSSLSLGNTPEHIEGLFYIQEASSMLPPVALFASRIEKPLNDWLVVDLAAAPGSKTTQLAAEMNNQGIILANELSASRLKSMHANLVRCGVINTCVSHQDAANIGHALPETFDYVLLDAPCGGEGTVRKDIRALQNWRLDKVQEIARLQKILILSAYKALKPGGIMVYSTCTLSPEENHQVAEYLLENSDAKVMSLVSLFPEAEKASTAEGYLHLMPQLFDSEGFFVARFQKPFNTGESDVKPVARYNSPFKPVTRKIRTMIGDYFSQQFGVDIIPEGFNLMQRDKEIWLFPAKIESLSPFIKINRTGIRVAQVFPGKVRSTYEFASCFGHQASKNIVPINQAQAAQYYQGRNIELDDSELANTELASTERVTSKLMSYKGEVLLQHQNWILDVAQLNQGKIKNSLPRDLVKDNYVF